jgi:TolB-like protein/tetratricopeptide (TPR) repeat protein
LIYQFNKITLDTAQYRLTLAGKLIAVEPQVFDLLEYLIKCKERVVTRGELLENLWKDKVVTDSALGTRLRDARKAVGDSGNRQEVIKTIHGRGYQFVGIVTEINDETENVGQPNPGLNKTNQASTNTPSIAVLPFQNMSSDSNKEYFSDGISEDIITELSRFPILRVIARHSSFVFKEDGIDVMEIGRKLGVGYIVEGSVRWGDNRVRITAQLIDAETGSHIWAERYDKEPDDIFAVQDEVTRAVVATIAAQLGKTLSENAARKSTTSIESYEYVLQANQQYFRFNREDNLKAAQLYQKAIDRDPQFSRAYAGLANTYTTDYFLGWQGTSNALQNGLECAQKALELDSNDALARVVLAWALIGNGRWEEAELELDRVLTLKPGDADVLAETGNGFKAVGRLEIGISLLEEATRLNPLFPDSYQRWLGQAYYRAGRYQEATNTLRAIRMEGWGYGWLAASFARTGEFGQARDALNKFVLQRQKELKSSAAEAITIAVLLGNYKDNFRHEVDWQHLLEGLRMAGLTE